MSESLFSGESPADSSYSSRYSKPVYDTYYDKPKVYDTPKKDVFDDLPSFNPAEQSLRLIKLVDNQQFLKNQKSAVTSFQSELISSIKQAILQGKSDVEFTAQFSLTDDAKIGGMASLSSSTSALEQAYQSLLSHTFERLKEKGYVARLEVKRVDSLSFFVDFPNLNLDAKKGFGNIL